MGFVFKEKFVLPDNCYCSRNVPKSDQFSPMKNGKKSQKTEKVQNEANKRCTRSNSGTTSVSDNKVRGNCFLTEYKMVITADFKFSFFIGSIGKCTSKYNRKKDRKGNCSFEKRGDNIDRYRSYRQTNSVTEPIGKCSLTR